MLPALTAKNNTGGLEAIAMSTPLENNKALVRKFFDAIARRSQHRAAGAVHQHRTHRHFATRCRRLGFGERQRHRILPGAAQVSTGRSRSTTRVQATRASRR